MKKRKLIRAMSLLIGGVIGVSCMSGLVGCQKGGKKDSIVLMTEELSGLFNPFYATAGTDMDVIGFTQIGMLTYDVDDDGKVEVASGDEYAVVAKAHDVQQVGNDTVYTFVIKNGLKFSDGVPLTMNDVFFNMYEYLDPVYTGSSTMYSVNIKGLTKYRTQKNLSGSAASQQEEQISRAALMLARGRREELINIYKDAGRLGGSDSNSYSLDEEGMKAAIQRWNATSDYKDAVATDEQQATLTNDKYQEMLLADYAFVLKTFKEEIQSDYRAAKESYDLNSKPYSDWTSKFSNDLFKFFFYEGYIKPEYEKVNGRDNKEKIIGFGNTDSILYSITTEEQAVQRVYSDKIKESLHEVLQFWGTAGTVLTEFQGTATEVYLKNTLSGQSSLTFPFIDGIVSLGHTTEETSVKIDGVTYNVAHEHNPDGTPKNPNEYDVLQITVEGTDPKAIYSFGFTVAPVHYYSNQEVNIKENKFGVEYASSSFQSNVIKALTHIEIPVGAGPYMATDRNNSDNPSGNGFSSGNIVYFKANPHFMFEVKTEKLRLQVVSPSDALDVLASGAVDYVTPQFTEANSRRLTGMQGSGYVKMDAWQLGYGYIGINAGKVEDLPIRKAIMSAMQTSLALTYYDTGTCKNIDWPMSMMSWAYPYQADGVTSKQNGHDYTQWPESNSKTHDQQVDEVKQKISGYMTEAHASSGDSRLKITFTIAGASITEHPTYEVFKQASEILNSMGWEITVRADTLALTKLSTGSLEVWAAAWGSTIDPDMYQVYHKNSTATSVYSWGYREIKAQPGKYTDETRIINALSEVIDEARETLDQATRTRLYEEAMGYVLDLAVELPVYQRKNLYAYNGKTVKGFAAKVNAYTSPLEKVWELELV